MKTIRARYSSDREDSLRLAFQALHKFDIFKDEGTTYFVPVGVIKRVLQVVRPRYTDVQVSRISATCGIGAF